MNQSFQNFELILLDDSSTDESREILDEYIDYAKVKTHIYNSKNSGSTFAQWEKGLSLSSGKWVWIAESDDFSDPDFLQILLHTAENADNTAIAFCDSHWVNQNSEEGKSLSLFKESFVHNGIDEIRNELIKHCTIQNVSSALLNRKYAVKSVADLGSYRACGDWIFYTRMLHHGNLIYLNKKLNYFRWYHQNISNASKNTLWATEGISVLENIDFRKIGLSRALFFDLIKFWNRKTLNLNFSNRLKARAVLIKASIKYLCSGFKLI